MSPKKVDHSELENKRAVTRWARNGMYGGEILTLVMRRNYAMCGLSRLTREWSDPIPPLFLVRENPRQRCATLALCRWFRNKRVLISCLMQVVPSFAEELCRKDLGSPDGASGYGFSLTADMHRRGISVRHMGLLRDMFWRPLQGTVDLSFNSNRIRTRTDMRLQLRRGDQVSKSDASFGLMYVADLA